MRFLLIIFLLLLLSFSIREVSERAAITTMIIGFIILIWGPMLFGFLKMKRYYNACDDWLKIKGHNYRYVKPELHIQTKGKLAWKVSGAQFVLSCKNSETEEYWFACGNWFWGTFSNKIKVYQNDKGTLRLVGEFDA